MFSKNNLKTRIILYFLLYHFICPINGTYKSMHQFMENKGLSFSIFPIFSLLLPQYYFPMDARYIKSTETSAGVTPLILEACPTDLGLKSFNFCLASSLNEETSS